MTTEFTRAMARATASVRAQNLSEATAILQAALAGSFQSGGLEPGTVQPDAPRAGTGFRIAPDVEDAETVGEGTSPRPWPGASGHRSLREVVDLLRAGREAFEGLDLSLPGGIGRPAAPPLPEGATFTWRNHASAAGSRRYRLFVPSCPPAELQGLVLMLHGCKQTPDDFAAGTGMNALAEAERLLVAYPEQPGGANISGCWNWFEPAHQGRDSGEPAILAALARELAAEFGLPSGRIFAAGLSAGGAMAAVLAETYPDVFAAVGIHSGLPYGAASDMASAFAAMRGQGMARASRQAGPGPRVIVFHGDADHTVHVGNAEAIVARLRTTGARAEQDAGTEGGRGWQRTRLAGPDGRPQVEFWRIAGAGHAWSGGHPSGSFTDAGGPSASAEMLRFFGETLPAGA